MRPYVRRIAAASAAAYLLAGWLAATLHSHGGHDHAAENPGACTTCSCGHGHANSEPEPQEPACPDDGHHHCVVCDFLAKPPAAAESVSLVEAPEPVAPAADPVAPAVEPADVRLLRTRGPPVA